MLLPIYIIETIHNMFSNKYGWSCTGQNPCRVKRKYVRKHFLQEDQIKTPYQLPCLSFKINGQIKKTNLPISEE